MAETIKENIENEESTVKAVDSYTLKKPILVDDEEIKEVVFDFDKMTGKDILKIDKELRSVGLMFDDLWNQNVILKLASRATGIIEDDLLSLHPGDYLEVTMRTRNFFIRW